MNDEAMATSSVGQGTLGHPRAYFIEGSDVNAALGDAGRAYLVGHLGRPQPKLNHVGDLETPVEVGTTRYDRPTAEQPHLHEWNADILFVIAGTYAVRILTTGESRVLTAGGTYVIEPGVPHVCVAAPSSQVLFVKTPGGNDKVDVELDEASKEWVEDMLACLSSHECVRTLPDIAGHQI